MSTAPAHQTTSAQWTAYLSHLFTQATSDIGTAGGIFVHDITARTDQWPTPEATVTFLVFLALAAPTAWKLLPHVMSLLLSLTKPGRSGSA